MNSSDIVADKSCGGFAGVVFQRFVARGSQGLPLLSCRLSPNGVACWDNTFNIRHLPVEHCCGKVDAKNSRGAFTAKTSRLCHYLHIL